MAVKKDMMISLTAAEAQSLSEILSGSIDSCDDGDDLKELISLLRKVDPAEAANWEKQLIAMDEGDSDSE